MASEENVGTVRMRRLGGTGIEVGAYCRCTMMFDKLGNLMSMSMSMSMTARYRG
ncbi:hypothetical protein [Streptomyces sp. NPDC005953]|uniref:hypothetical protein n=1 Tax=Streptomyces sp. NPDC005953 TaxID=3156719 RepID=UPI0033E980B2